MGIAVCMAMTVDVGIGMIMDTDIDGFVRGGHANYVHNRLSYLAEIGACACTQFSYLANSETCMNTVYVYDDADDDDDAADDDDDDAADDDDAYEVDAAHGVDGLWW